MYDGRKAKARITDIVKFFSVENFQNSLKARNTCLFFSYADRQSEIGNRKLESWTLGHFEYCVFVCFVFFVFTFSTVLYEFFVFILKCYALSKDLNAFDQILIF